MSILTLMALGAVALVGTIVTLVLVLVKTLAPADFSRRPSAQGLPPEQVAPPAVESFRRSDLTPGEAPGSMRASYSGASGDGPVTLTAIRVGSVVDAANRLKTERHTNYRTTSVSKIAGDHSFFVSNSDGMHTIAWTNAEWVFFAQSENKPALRALVGQYPY